MQVAGFKGGLHGLLNEDPPPVSVSMALMREEHCNVMIGFGKSDEYFVTSNYGGNRTNARDEFLHVVDPDSAPPVPKESKDGAAVSFREKIAFSYFVKNMSLLIAQSFAKIPGTRCDAMQCDASAPTLEPALRFLPVTLAQLEALVIPHTCSSHVRMTRLGGHQSGGAYG